MQVKNVGGHCEGCVEEVDEEPAVTDAVSVAAKPGEYTLSLIALKGIFRDWSLCWLTD